MEKAPQALEKWGVGSPAIREQALAGNRREEFFPRPGEFRKRDFGLDKHDFSKDYEARPVEQDGEDVFPED